MDVRAGGKWQYITRTSGGEVVDFHGTYKEVVAPEKLVYSFLFGDMPEGDGFVEITLVEKDGVTELRDRGVFSSKEERDAVIASGMESGARETYERLSRARRGPRRLTHHRSRLGRSIADRSANCRASSYPASA